MSTNNPMSNIPPLGPPTGMMPGQGPGKFKPVDPLRVLRANWLWLVAALVVGVVLGGGVWFALNRYAPKYTSEAQFRVEASNINPDSRNNGAFRMVELEPIILSEVQTLLAEPILRQILSNPSVQDNTKWFSQFNGNLDLAYDDLSENVISANHLRETSLFNARATTTHEADAQIILTALRDEYLRQKNLQVNAEQERDLLAARDRLNAAETKITAKRGEIKRFLTTNPLESLDDRNSEAALRVSRLVIEVNELAKSYNSLKATYEQLLAREKEGNFDPSDEERQVIEADREIQGIDNQILNLRVQRESLLDKFKPQHPTVRNIDMQILAFERERKMEHDKLARILFNAKLEQAALGLQIVESELGAAQNSLSEWTLRRQEFVRLKQEYDTLNRELEQAEDERKLADAMIQDLLELDRTQARVVVREAVSPQKAKQTSPAEPVFFVPGVALVIVGMVTGLIFLRELMDQRVRSAADVKMVPDAALIGMIPDASEDPGASKKIERVVEQHPSGLLAEAFRQVRTAVLSKIDRRGYKTLMLVSAKPNAGVTAIAQNLAASCALSGRRVLVIDANFRRPAMAALMNQNDRPGLAELLSGEEPIDSVGELAQQTGTQGLSLLPAGNSANAAVELFENPRFRELLARLEADYDLLIIDAPPALLTSDAQLLSRHVDAMLLVSRAQSDTRGMLQRLYRELDGQRADILGIVLNGVLASAGGYLKRNFREFHAYSGTERRQADRATQPARSPEPIPVAASSATAQANGAEGYAEQPVVDIILDDQGETDPTPGDDDIFGGFDADDDDKR